MTPGNRIEIIDRDGWRKDFPLEKPLLHMGSDARNDIVLDERRGAGVALRQLQLIALADGRPGYRAINLGETEVPVTSGGPTAAGAGESRTLAPRSVTQVADGDCVQLGEFLLIFHLSGAGDRPAAAAARPERAPRAPRSETVAREPAGPGTSQTSASIGLRLAFARPVVHPDEDLEGIITVQNLGQEPGAQFRLRVEGLEPDCYEIGPGPILFPQVEKGVYLRISHPRGPAILAGKREVLIRATAPEAYPGESVAVSQAIEFLPYYHHTLRLVQVE
ncbi:MAG: hypothetical protein EHM56_04525 [Chloroflexi bacterium]|nr:MAG: hypothetical protein EHM56_04525 [Chloroflexota bacterium]